MRLKNPKRGAFTLVELLVAAGIIAMLLGLVAISYPSINEREQLTRAVDKLRTGFLTARLWARRDQVVTGLRWNTDATPAAGGATGLFYIQQPLENYDGNLEPVDPSTFTMVASSNRKVVNVKITRPAIPASGTRPDPFSRIKIPGANGWSSGDYLVIESDVPHKIVGASPTAPLQGTITLASDISINPVFGHLCRIVRSAEDIPLQEETLFGDNIKVLAPSSEPILFLPTGQVFNSRSNQVVFQLVQTKPDGSTETADVTLDCLSGTTRYQNP